MRWMLALMLLAVLTLVGRSIGGGLVSLQTAHAHELEHAIAVNAH